jgi:hypothetical protein
VVVEDQPQKDGLQKQNMHRKSLIILSLWIGIFTCSGVSLGAPATDLKTLLPSQDLPAGWAPVGGPRVYSKKTLFEHVDGQAILYLTYGFQRSVFGIFQNGKNPEDQIEVDIYDMGNVLHAFGVFSRFRNDDRPGGIGLDSYLDDRSIFFYKGKYFIMLYATETNASNLKQLAMTLSAKIVDSSPPPKEIHLFPKDGLKTGSIQYFPEGLLGHDFLGRGFQASYVDKGERGDKNKVEAKVKVEENIKAKAGDKNKVEAKVKVEENIKAKAEDKNKVEAKVKVEENPQAQTQESHLFLAIFKSPKAAKEALTTYKNYISKKGKILPGTPATFGPDAWKGEDPYQGQLIVLQRGLHLMGAAGFPDKRGELYLDTFMKNIR